jgi:hypothetical protein
MKASVTSRDLAARSARFFAAGLLDVKYLLCSMDEVLAINQQLNADKRAARRRPAPVLLGFGHGILGAPPTGLGL